MVAMRKSTGIRTRLGIGIVAAVLAIGSAQATILQPLGTAWHNGYGAAAGINDTLLTANWGAYYNSANHWPWTPTVHWAEPVTVNTIFYPVASNNSANAVQFQYSYDAWDSAGGSTMTWHDLATTVVSEYNPFIKAWTNEPAKDVRAVRFVQPKPPAGNIDQSQELWVQGGWSTYPGKWLWESASSITSSFTGGIPDPYRLFDNINNNANNWGPWATGGGDVSANNWWHTTLWEHTVAVDGVFIFGNGADYTAKGLHVLTLKPGGDPDVMADWLLQYSDNDNPNTRIVFFDEVAKTNGLRIHITQAGTQQSFIRDMVILDGGAVPEPGTLSILLVALAGLLHRRTRRA